MRTRPGLVVFRLLPVVLVAVASMVYVAYVEGPDAYVARNILPMFAIIGLGAVALYKGEGSWTGKGLRWTLGSVGFAIPALGLSLYLHYGYAANLDHLFAGALYPLELFRFLPAYTLFAGGIGFAIGWIAGRNVSE